MDTARQPQSEDSVDSPFYDGFLQDRNIKWILASGAAILLGSSLMLVSTHWGGYSPLLKQVILLAYTYGIFAAGRYGYQRLALRRTGTMLLALSLLLAPIACAALHWVWDVESVSWNVVYVALLIAGGGLTALIGAKTFRHFLHEPQPTLTVAYTVLSLAGAIVPSSSLERSPLIALALWCVFAVGAIKANRRVFWLVEEHRQPRIIGFFPMALLGAQFLGLFTLCYAERTALDWIGFGCVLTALPLLTAADAVAKVFQQRTGNLVRPLPWSVLAPLGCGLTLCVTGVVLAATNVPTGKPFALVPSAALAAVLMSLVARRTQRREFAYVAIALTIVAYRFLPVFFAEAARNFVQSAATAIREPKLPFAFYGFTFVPLLSTYTFASEALRRRGDHLFAEPLRQTAVSLALAFLALSLTDEKATFPAAATLTLVFAAQTAVFKNRLLAIPAIIAACFAAAGAPEFYNGVLMPRYPATFTHALSSSTWFLCETAMAVLLSTVGLFVDRLLVRYPVNFFGQVPTIAVNEQLKHPCRQAGLLLTIGLSGLWLLDYFLPTAGMATMPAVGLLVGTALWQAALQRRPEIGLASVLFANVVLGIVLAENFVELDYVAMQTFVLVTQWIASYVLERHPDSRLGEVFGPALRKCSRALLSLAFVGFVLPGHALVLALRMRFDADPILIWVTTATFLAWSFDAARRETHAFFGSAAIMGLFILTGSAARTFLVDSLLWLPAIWTVVAAALVPFELLFRRDDKALPSLREPLRNIVPTLLLAVSVGSWIGLSSPLFVAGFAAPAVLAMWLAVRRHALRIQLPLVLLNWRLLGVAAAAACPKISHIGQFTAMNVAEFSLPVALTAVLSMLVWATAAGRLRKLNGWNRDLDLVKPQQYGLRLVAAYLMMMSLSLPKPLDVASIITAAAVFAVLIAIELRDACLQYDERSVWFAEGLAAAAVAYFAWFEVIQFGRGFAMYAVLGAGLLLWTLGRLAERRPSTIVMAYPFQMTGRYLPLVTVALALYRHVTRFEMVEAPIVWLGWNSLALLATAAFYFHQGLQTRNKNFTVLAAAVLNTAFMLLWRELRWHDPQFYMIPVGITVLALVELLEREIPEAYHDPLRYAGALIILVSPTVHIVDGSWLHIFTLMVAAAIVILAGIGLRIRAMLYTGTAFLIADLGAMVIRGSIDRPELLWVAGLGLGAAVLGVGAVCEMKRERILQRVRAVTASLESWK